MIISSRLKSAKLGQRTLLTQKFDEKDTSVFTKKKKRSLLSLKNHFCHKKDSSVTKYFIIFHNFYASGKRKFLSHQKTVLSYYSFLPKNNVNIIKCLWWPGSIKTYHQKVQILIGQDDMHIFIKN